uniref:Uncharacterized protein n=1 Tax=Arundo donax TaxID=35708 RepID=A0A0A9BGL6_ARUDO
MIISLVMLCTMALPLSWILKFSVSVMSFFGVCHLI